MADSVPAEKSLYQRIGGYDMIAAIVDEFIGTFATDPKMARFLGGMSLEIRRRNRQFTIDFLSAESGGPTFYLGPNMKTAHEGLGISAEDWKIAMGHIERALAKLKVPEREAREFMALFERRAGEIIEP